MGAFLAYNLKLSICFLLFYLLYKFLFCRNTFHKANRILLVFSYIFILFVPLLEINTKTPLETYQLFDNLEYFLIQSVYISQADIPDVHTINWTDIVLMVYIVGIIVFALRYLYLLFQIQLLLWKGEKQKLDNGINLIITKSNISPFSWFNYILISEADYKENKESILIHELAHVRCKHSFDLLIAELFTIVQWYNPAVWLIKKEIKDIHEFEADNTVIDSGVDVKNYQLLLIKKAVGTQRFNSMTNSFNHSKLKKRITMMLKKKTSRWAAFKYLAILPLAALSIVIFARPEISDRLDEISEAKVSHLSVIVDNSQAVLDTVIPVRKGKVIIQNKVEENQLGSENRIIVEIDSLAPIIYNDQLLVDTVELAKINRYFSEEGEFGKITKDLDKFFKENGEFAKMNKEITDFFSKDGEFAGMNEKLLQRIDSLKIEGVFNFESKMSFVNDSMFTFNNFFHSFKNDTSFNRRMEELSERLKNMPQFDFSALSEHMKSFNENDFHFHSVDTAAIRQWRENLNEYMKNAPKFPGNNK